MKSQLTLTSFGAISSHMHSLFMSLLGSGVQVCQILSEVFITHTFFHITTPTVKDTELSHQPCKPPFFSPEVGARCLLSVKHNFLVLRLLWEWDYTCVTVEAGCLFCSV